MKTEYATKFRFADVETTAKKVDEKTNAVAVENKKNILCKLCNKDCVVKDNKVYQCIKCGYKWKE